MKNDKPKPVKMSIFNHTPKNNYMICENDENTPSIMPLFTEISGQNDSECKTLNTKDCPFLHYAIWYYSREWLSLST